MLELQRFHITLSSLSKQIYASGLATGNPGMQVSLLVGLGWASVGKWAAMGYPGIQGYLLLKLGWASLGKWGATGNPRIRDYLLLGLG